VSTVQPAPQTLEDFAWRERVEKQLRAIEGKIDIFSIATLILAGIPVSMVEEVFRDMAGGRADTGPPGAKPDAADAPGRD
jgi:hypothetical protein